ncbi:unnamed protein product [Lampetra fluviatilis]
MATAHGHQSDRGASCRARCTEAVTRSAREENEKNEGREEVSLCGQEEEVDEGSGVGGGVGGGGGGLHRPRWPEKILAPPVLAAPSASITVSVCAASRSMYGAARVASTAETSPV